MSNKKTIGEIYGLDSSDIRINCHLDQWYVDLLNKKKTDLSINDICRMIVQDTFVELSVECSKRFLEEDPLAGEAFDGQLVKLLSSLDIKKYKSLTIGLIEVLKDGVRFIDLDDFFTEVDYEEYIDFVDELISKLK